MSSIDCLKSDECIPVDQILPDYLCKLFPFQNFNKMQSHCLEAWNSNHNMLISAPTGAGKTVCFELSILRNIHKVIASSPTKHLGSAGLQGKLLYIAPTKSICLQLLEEWKKKFAFLGIRVELVTSDASTSNLNAKLSNADLILATAEMWDVVIRASSAACAQGIGNQISLLLLDEVHHVGGTRGAIFESVVTRMLVANQNGMLNSDAVDKPDPIASLRVIAVSATIANILEVGRWLKILPNYVKHFDATYRPVSLQYHVFGYFAQNPWLYNRVYERQILGVVLKFGEGKPALVFCTSRRQTTTMAQAVLEQLRRDPSHTGNSINQLTKVLSEKQNEKLNLVAKECDDPLLRSLLTNGIAIHNADMNKKSRGLVERLFKESLIMCLFCTSTLAQGVNLPARLVAIAGTTVYHDGQLQEYSRSSILQMCGRAGRSGLDTQGVAVLMTAKANVSRYRNIDNGKAEVLESQLEPRLLEIFNTEVAAHVVTDVTKAEEYLKSSFYWTRKTSAYSQDSDQATSIAKDVVNTLIEKGVVQYDDDLFGISSSPLGTLLAKHSICFTTLAMFTRELSKARSQNKMFRLISSSTEVAEGVFVRRSERKRLNGFNEYIRMPIAGKVNDSVDKVFILLQIAISQREVVKGLDYSLGNEAQRLLQRAYRVCNFLIDVLISQAINAPFETIRMGLRVSRALLGKCIWDGPTTLRQIPGISLPHMTVLAKQGINTISKFAQLEAKCIAQILSVRQNLAQTMLQKLRRFPRFTVTTEAMQGKDADRKEESISILVDIASQLGNNLADCGKPLHGFILAGSRSDGVLLLERFSLNENVSKRFACQVPANTLAQSRCIEMLVGCESITGLDFYSRIPEAEDQRQGISKGSVGIPGSVKPMNCPSRFRLSVTAGRISKKLVDFSSCRKEAATSLPEEKKLELYASSPSPASQRNLPGISYRNMRPCASSIVKLRPRPAYKQTKLKRSGISTLAGGEENLKSMTDISLSAKALPTKLSSLKSRSSLRLGREYDDLFLSLF